MSTDVLNNAEPAALTEDVLQLTEKLIAGSIADLMTECSSDECDALEAFVRSIAQSKLQQRRNRPGFIADLEWNMHLWREGK